MDDTPLRTVARAKIADGTLPRHDPVRTWAGPGIGQPCAVCGQPIPRSDTEYELQFANDTATLRFHRRCQAAWDAARFDRVGH